MTRAEAIKIIERLKAQKDAEADKLMRMCHQCEAGEGV